ncbi:hypothetical protein RNJ44_04807 [Nakaseomyces bracarensis]|uniref:2-dehydropantoate 2-reductase n=1 Tax=Nakaseomyces bracarensis TaxID=273131 RepID=A0ABR4NWD0_9SACH
MSTDCNVVIVGAGGVGVVSSLSMYHAGKCEVSMVVRSDYDTVVEHGYTIDSCDYGALSGWRPHQVYRDVQEAASSGKFFDYVVITTKNIPDGPRASTMPVLAQPFLESNEKLDPTRLTSIVLIQNGIDIEKELITTLKPEEHNNYVVLSGVEIVGSTKVGKAQIKQVGTDNLSIGAFDPSDKRAVESAKRFAVLYDAGDKNHVEFDERVRYSRWKKLLYNAAINTTTAIVGLDVPRTIEFGHEDNTKNAIFLPAMHDIVNIAASEGIVIEEKFIEFFVNISAKRMFTPSMCVDVQKGQLMELEVILGNPLKIAKQNGVETPTLTFLYNILAIIQNKLKEQNGLLKFDESTCSITD